ncbi:chorismate mutase [Methanobrevibacter filiformis]|uniref:Chorismate mutase n=1 Tax=Methanobrevibacter filiformis TaxID=55758 RepID=A0A166F9L6_9EURY|nr:chorismate mutase [Methanobrevibacter filiformis]KZX17442.1 chorismate mutase [Methanobrevibacter filiformis]
MNKDNITIFKNKSEAQSLLNESRLEIDKIDENLIELFARRTALSKNIVSAKKYINVPIYDKNREKEIQNKIKNLANDKNIDENIILKIMNLLFDLNKFQQEKFLEE